MRYLQYGQIKTTNNENKGIHYKAQVDAPHIWNQNQGGIDDKWQADQPKQDLITLNWIATWKKRSD